jgi:hypothetical protein
MSSAIAAPRMSASTEPHAAASWLPPPAVWLVFAITLLLYRNATLNHFYAFGSGTDPFWFAGVLWHGDLALHGPPGIDERPFYFVHVSPLLTLPALLSHVLPFSPQQWLALVLGFMHAFTTAALTWCACMAAGTKARSGMTQLLAGAIGCAFALCALQAEFMGLPHYEIILPGLLIAFLAALALRNIPVALVFFILLLGAREDAGLHAFAFLAPLIVLVRWRQGRWLQHETYFAAAGLAVSLVLIVVMPQFTSYHQSLFREHYVGEPPFAHVTPQQVQERLHFLALQNAHIWGPPAALILAGLLRRDWLTLVGGVAVLPWVLLHTLLGIHITVWTMGFYYGFPVLAAIAWPSLLRLYRTGPAQLRGSDAQWLLLQGIVVLLASMPTLSKELPMYGSRYAFLSFAAPGSLARMEGYREFEALLPSARPALGVVAANLAAVGLDPFTLRRDEWLEALPADDAALARIDTVVLFAAPFQCPQFDTLIARMQLPYAFTVPGTRVRLLTRKLPEELQLLAGVLVPQPPPAQNCGEPLARVR